MREGMVAMPLLRMARTTPRISARIDELRARHETPPVLLLAMLQIPHLTGGEQSVRVAHPVRPSSGQARGCRR